MPVKNSLKPEPSWPWPICLAPCATRLVAWSTLVLSAAPAGPQDRATIARNAGVIHSQRSLRIMTHLLQGGWDASMLAPRRRAACTLRPSTREVNDQGDDRDDQEKVNQAPREVKHEPAERPGDKQHDEGGQRRR